MHWTETISEQGDLIIIMELMLQVEIPSSDTTYWCETFRLPEEMIDTTHYITRVKHF